MPSRLEPVDLAVLDSERRRWPAVMHVEFDLCGDVDTDRLARAYRLVAQRHERITAAVASRGWLPGATWQRVGSPGVPVLEVERLDPVRNEWISRAPPVESGPMVDMTYVRTSDGGRRMWIRAHHAAVDGQSLFALVGEVAEAMAAIDDEGEGADSVVGSAPSSSGPRPTTPRAATDASARHILRAQRVDRVVGPPRTRGPRPTGFGITTSELSPEVIGAATMCARRLGVSLNDVFVAAMHLTVATWNEERGRVPGRIGVTVPFSLRLGPVETLGNATSQASTISDARDRLSPDHLATRVSALVRNARTARHADPAAHLPLMRWSPLAGRRVVARLGSAITRDRLLDTIRVSNVGRVGPLAFGEARVSNVWFSPPTRMPQGVALGIARYGDQITLALRWCAELFDDEAGAAFCSTYATELGRLT